MLSLRKNPTLYEAIIEADQRSMGYDPNHGCRKRNQDITESGIKVQVGVLEKEVRRQNEVFSSISELNCRLSC